MKVYIIFKIFLQTNVQRYRSVREKSYSTTMKFTLIHKRVSRKINKAVRHTMYLHVQHKYAYMHVSSSAIAASTLKTFLYNLYL